MYRPGPLFQGVGPTVLRRRLFREEVAPSPLGRGGIQGLKGILGLALPTLEQSWRALAASTATALGKGPSWGPARAPALRLDRGNDAASGAFRRAAHAVPGPLESWHLHGTVAAL